MLSELQFTMLDWFTYSGKPLMILDGMRCPNEATTPKSQQSFCFSFGSGQTEIGRLCCFAYFATKQGWGLGAGTTTDNSLTILPSCLHGGNSFTTVSFRNVI
jgi:hypothetical protein